MEFCMVNINFDIFNDKEQNVMNKNCDCSLCNYCFSNVNRTLYPCVLFISK